MVADPLLIDPRTGRERGGGLILSFHPRPALPYNERLRCEERCIASAPHHAATRMAETPVNRRTNQFATSRGSAIALLAGTLLIFAGCVSEEPVAESGDLETPTAALVSASQTARSDEGSRLVAAVDVTNPNQVALPVIEVFYTVKVDGVGEFSFTQTGDSTLYKGGTQRLLLPSAFKTTKDLSGATYSVDGWLSYQPPGEVRKLLTDTGWPLPRVWFSGSGRVE